MSKLVVDIEIPEKYEQSRVREVIRKVQDTVNDLAEGRARVRYQSASTTPGFGTYSLGDWVFNSSPSELGTVGGKYVLLGWVNVSAGAPGTFKEMRALTGN